MLKWLSRGSSTTSREVDGIVLSEVSPQGTDLSLPPEEEVRSNGQARGHEEELEEGRRGEGGEPEWSKQVIAALTAAFTHLGIGTVFGYSGVTLPELTDPTSDDLVLSTAQAALFSSVINLGAAMGSTFSGAPQVWLGQRMLMLVTLPVSLATWLMVGAASEAWMVLAARAVQGVALGFLAGASNNYVAEVAHARIRGVLVATLDVSRQLGYLLVYAAGSSDLGWRQVARICGVATHLVPLLGFLCLPNSPRWLASQGRLGEARVALVFFRGRLYDCDGEMAAMARGVRPPGAEGHCEEGVRRGARSQLEAMTDPNTLGRILLLTLLLFLSNFGGSFVVGAYVVPIFAATDVVASPYAAAVAIGGVRVAGTLFYLALVDRIARKTLLVSSSLTCAAAMALLGSFFYDHAHSDDVRYQHWLPVAALTVFTVASGTALPVLSLFRTEILPTSVRATAVAFLYAVFFLAAFAASHSYPGSVIVLGHHGTFWTYAICAAIVAIVGGIALPETKGKTLEHIGQHPHEITHHNGDVVHGRR